MLRLHQKIIKYSIINPNIAHSPKQYKKDRKLDLYPIVGFKQIRLGAFSLNMPTNQNLLTLEAMQQLFRYLNTYQHDHTIQNIWIQNRGSTFSGGADYIQMINNQQYLDKLFKLIVLIAKLNKPTFAYLKGGVRGVSSYILSMLTVPLSDNFTSMKIDQTQRGFIPIGGGSHRLSRLPANIGLYLALTGKKLTSDQMSRLGYIKGFVKQGVSTKQLRHQISRSNLYFRDPLRYNTFDIRPTQAKQTRLKYKKERMIQKYINISQKQIFQDGQNIFTRFALNQHKIYNIAYQNQINPDNTFTQKPGRNIINYYQLRHQKAFNTLKKQGLIQNSDYKYFRLPNEPLVKITKVFGYQTLEQTIKQLQKDSSQWAKQTLRQIRKKDPLAMHLTFKLLKLAEKLPFDKCLQLQYRVAKKLLKQSKSALKQTYAGSKIIYVNKYSDKKIQDISNEEIQNYFKEVNDEEYILQRQIAQNSLLPNNDYAQIPDSARTYLNKIFFDDTHLRNQQIQLKRFFSQQKIDYRAPNFTIDTLRQKYYQYLESINITQKQSHRLEILLNNQQQLRKFKQQRENYVKNFSQEKLNELIKENINQCFSKGIGQRFKEFQKTASIAGLQQKLKIFKNMKKTMIKSVIFNGPQIQAKNKSSNEKFKGLIYFDKKGKSILESTNPLVESNQALKQLNQSLGDSKQVSQEYKSRHGSTPTQKNLGYSGQLFQQQLKRQKIFKMIQKRYKDNPRQWEDSHQYIQLVYRASQTSDQFAGMLQWTNTDFENIILASPKTVQTYGEKADKISSAIKQKREQLKQELTQFKKKSQQTIQNILHQNNQKIMNSTFNLFPQAIIPKEFKYFKTILKQVVKFFEVKHNDEVSTKNKQILGGLDHWIDGSEFNQFIQQYKWDIQFIFSYISILKLKEILSSLKINGLKNIQELKLYLNSLRLDFQTNDKDQINKIISRFLYNMLDMHTISKAKITLPQTKLLEFFNRLKIKKQTQQKSPYPLSFESLMLLIGKDRLKIYNKLLQEYLPTQPQFLLQIANKQTKQNTNDKLNINDEISASNYVFQNYSTPAMKSLISGYQYYILLFDGYIQKAAGKYSFLNNTLMNADKQQVRRQLKDILNLSISNQQWFKSNIKKYIHNFFEMRKHYEKYFTKGQLLAFDQQKRQALEPQIVKSVLQYKINAQIKQTKELFAHSRKYQSQIDMDNQSEKHQQLYYEIRSNIRNPQAFRRLNNYKLIEKVQKLYFVDSKKKQSSIQQQEDLQQETRQFQSYQRMSKNTQQRWLDQIFDYPAQQKEFKPAIQQQAMQIRKSLSFSEVEKDFDKKIHLTDFTQEIKQLKNVLKQQKSLNEVLTKIQSL